MQEDRYIGEFIFSWKQSWGTDENVSDTRWAQLESMWRRHKREDSHILFLINTMWWFWPSEQQNKKLKEQLVLLLLWNGNLFCLYRRAQETRKRQAAFVLYEVTAWWLWILCMVSYFFVTFLLGNLGNLHIHSVTGFYIYHQHKSFTKALLYYTDFWTRVSQFFFTKFHAR